MSKDTLNMSMIISSTYDGEEPEPKFSLHDNNADRADQPSLDKTRQKKAKPLARVNERPSHIL